MSLLLLFNQVGTSPAQEVFDEIMTFLHLNDNRTVNSTQAPIAHLTHMDNAVHYNRGEDVSLLSTKHSKTLLAHNQSDAELLEKENISIMHTESKETYVS